MLAHHRFVEKTGLGETGVIWKSEDTKLSRSVAVKVPPPELAEDKQHMSRFEREAKLVLPGEGVERSQGKNAGSPARLTLS